METQDLDLLAWQGVRDELLVLTDATRNDSQTRPFAASTLHRLAIVHLRSAVVREQPELTEGLEGATVDSLQLSLCEQLKGRPHTFAVLEALTPEDRAEAQRLVDEALSLDPLFVPALHAHVALARVETRWGDVISGWHRVLEVDQRPEARALAFEVLADVHWRELDKKDAALGYLRAALDVDPTAADRIDKLLKLNLELENWEDAILCCHQLIELVDGDASKGPLAVTYRLTLGEIFVYGMGEPGVALRHYLYARGLMPDYELTYTLLKELLAANPWTTLQAQYAACEDEHAPQSPAAFAHITKAVAAKQAPVTIVEALRALKP